jgi:SAM-dependent methyltransferase
MSNDRRAHWQRVYGNKEPDEVSWYQPVPEKSLQLIRETGIAKSEPILDLGGGASTLVDNLLAEGYTDISVLDISANALGRSRERLGDAAETVTWIESDATTFKPERRYTLWHDRAVLHFLTESADRDKYLEAMRSALKSGGYFVLATFGPEGPERCSGLAVQRYGIDELRTLLGKRFELHAHELVTHVTPEGSTQQFLYSSWRSITGKASNARDA